MKNILFILSIYILFVSAGCKKDEQSGPMKAVFSYSVNGFTATFSNFTDFTNYSKPYATYEWDFGDGETSTVNSPFHVFHKVGKYLVTLKATKGNQVSSFSDSVKINGPNINIDGSFTDWQYVSTLDTNTAGNSTLLSVKVFSSGKEINFYLEGTPDFSSETPIHFFFDTDLNPATGYQSGDFPAGSGADVLYEGVLYDWGSFSSYDNQGDPTAWTWTSIGDQSSVSIGFKVSDIEELENGNKAVEFSINKAAIGLQDEFNFAIEDLNSGWAPQGSVPASGTDDAKFLSVDL